MGGASHVRSRLKPHGPLKSEDKQRAEEMHTALNSVLREARDLKRKIDDFQAVGAGPQAIEIHQDIDRSVRKLQKTSGKVLSVLTKTIV
eukprot:SAG31_NODE_6414_length_2028_cov_9.931052_3_plen_89_part_00